MKFLVFRVASRIQSWPPARQFGDRVATAPAPTLSGVLGLMGAAIGADVITRERWAEYVALARTLTIAVRVDTQGRQTVDFKTAPHRASDGKPTGKRTIQWRTLLQGACFTVVASTTEPLLKQIHEALTHPRFALYFGIRAAVPDFPLFPMVVDAPGFLQALDAADRHLSALPGWSDYGLPVFPPRLKSTVYWDGGRYDLSPCDRIETGAGHACDFVLGPSRASEVWDDLPYPTDDSPDCRKILTIRRRVWKGTIERVPETPERAFGREVLDGRL